MVDIQKNAFIGETNLQIFGMVWKHINVAACGRIDTLNCPLSSNKVNAND